jgi:hypothetical protein
MAVFTRRVQVDPAKPACNADVVCMFVQRTPPWRRRFSGASTTATTPASMIHPFPCMANTNKPRRTKVTATIRIGCCSQRSFIKA